MVNREIKQVIVMRADLNMRKGKMVAQGSHASVLAFKAAEMSGTDYPGNKVRAQAKQWFTEGMTKICVRCDSEEELLELEQKARAANLIVRVVTDAGLTEFAGTPTKTCLAIGPGQADKIDEITGGLKLL
jgi:PTH2 family peptidyl-tRNA hydrolase